MNAPPDDLVAQVALLFRDRLEIDVPSPDTDLLDTGRLDSVGVVELLLELEREFGVRVEMEDLELGHFRTLSSIAAFVATRLNEGTPERAAG